MEVVEYLPKGWRDYVGQPDFDPRASGVTGSGMVFVTPPAYVNPQGDKQKDTYPASGQAPAGDLTFLSKQLLDASRVQRAVLAHGAGRLLAMFPHQRLAEATVRAANDWSIDRWLNRNDDRLYSLVLVPSQEPSAAAREIRRAGAHDRMVGVLMSANSLGKLFGHPIYHPIYAAAADMSLPVVVHAGADASPDALTHPAAGGLPLTFGEFSSLAAMPLMSHLASFIGQGIFEKFPGLKVMFLGAGTAWLPAIVYRLDQRWLETRSEVPWVRRPPSDYIREHVRISTFPLDRPGQPESLVRLLESFGHPQDYFCFGSGYPDWNYDSVVDVASRLKPNWHKKIFYENALEFFRWPPPPDFRIAAADKDSALSGPK